MNQDNVNLFFRIARERYSIKLLREKMPHSPELWTDDEIFRRWRFCNVFREDDKTTAWFRRNIRGPLSLRGPDVMLATALFRWFNRIDTADKIVEFMTVEGYSEDGIRKALEGHKPLVTGAYMIKTPAGMNKLEGILWCMRPYVKDVVHLATHVEPETTLEGMWTVLRMYPYLGSFMSYEIVSDLRHTCLLRNAPDIMTWAAAGPGCARGLGWVVAGEPEAYGYTSAKDQLRMLALMKELLAISQSEAQWPKCWPKWEMREVEHWLCETWKYVRCRDYGQPPKEKFRCTTPAT